MGFELDPLRAELRGPDGDAIKLRPRTFEMLRLFAGNAGRVVGKQELLETLWPNVNVGDGSLFQCIRELRAALNDDQRQMIRLATGGGYIFTADVSVRSDTNGARAAEPARSERRGKLAISVMPLVATGNDERGATLAAGATDRLIDGLAGIDAIRVVAPQSSVTRNLSETASWSNADFVVQGELQRAERTRVLHARIIKTGSGEVRSFADVSIDIDEPDTRLQQIRLAAGVGHPLALHLNALQEVGEDHEASGGPSAKIVIEQALASNSQTSRERFAISQTMLENAIAAEPDNLDLKLALATLQLRGVQMLWYGPAGRDSIETGLKSIRSLLDYALATKPKLHSGDGCPLPLPEHDEPVRREPDRVREDAQPRSVERGRALSPRSLAALPRPLRGRAGDVRSGLSLRYTSSLAMDVVARRRLGLHADGPIRRCLALAGEIARDHGRQRTHTYAARGRLSASGPHRRSKGGFGKGPGREAGLDRTQRADDPRERESGFSRGRRPRHATHGRRRAARRVSHAERETHLTATTEFSVTATMGGNSIAERLDRLSLTSQRNATCGRAPPRRSRARLANTALEHCDRA
jgi:DNA-binding winged helix-turn-helix (wHTH) protein